MTDPRDPAREPHRVEADRRPRLGPTVRVEGLTVLRRHRRVVWDVTATLHSGVTALLGPNGAGKSTILRVLATLLRPTGGSISLHLDGDLITNSVDLRRRIGYVPQHLVAPPGFTNREFLRYVSWLKAIPRSQVDDAVAQVAQRCALTEQVLESAGRQVSGGEQRRVAVAQAIIGAPELLLLDEATAGVDLRTGEALLDLIKDLARDRIVVMATHQLDDVYGVADRAIVMSEGTIRDDFALGSAGPPISREQVRERVRVALGASASVAGAPGLSPA